MKYIKKFENYNDLIEEGIKEYLLTGLMTLASMAGITQTNDFKEDKKAAEIVKTKIENNDDQIKDMYDILGLNKEDIIKLKSVEIDSIKKEKIEYDKTWHPHINVKNIDNINKDNYILSLIGEDLYCTLSFEKRDSRGPNYGVYNFTKGLYYKIINIDIEGSSILSKYIFYLEEKTTKNKIKFEIYKNSIFIEKYFSDNEWIIKSNSAQLNDSLKVIHGKKFPFIVVSYFKEIENKFKGSILEFKGLNYYDINSAFIDSRRDDLPQMQWGVDLYHQLYYYRVPEFKGLTKKELKEELKKSPVKKIKSFKYENGKNVPVPIGNQNPNSTFAYTPVLYISNDIKTGEIIENLKGKFIFKGVSLDDNGNIILLFSNDNNVFYIDYYKTFSSVSGFINPL
jgi:flagellar hook protein FlgE